MKVLAIETTGPEKSLALAEDGRVLAELVFDGDLRTAFWPRLEQLLAGRGVTVPDCALYAACAGPGSWTGVRFGLAVVKGWATVTGRPVFVLSAPDLAGRPADGRTPAGVLAAAATPAAACPAAAVRPCYGKPPRFRRLGDR